MGEDEVLRAATAALLPAYVILSPRSQAKVAADAMEALKKLAGTAPQSIIPCHWHDSASGPVAAEHMGLGSQQLRLPCASHVQACQCYICKV